MPDPFTKPTNKFLKVLKVIFLTKFPMSLLLLLVIISIFGIGFSQLRSETPTGSVILEEEYPACVCEQPECIQDCDLCPIKTKIETKEVLRYQCRTGEVVDDLDDCVDLPEVSVESSGTVEGITLAIDNIEFEKDDDDSGFITRVDYTIINKADFPIVPKMEVKVYEDWTLKVKKTVANKIINPEIVINPNDFVQRKDRVRIFFKGKEQTVRLLLVDSLPSIEIEVVAVTKDIQLD